MTHRRQRLGREGEELAARCYEQRGYVILARNWRVREGEIDIVAWRDGTLVFCEVKTRSSDRFGTAAEAVGWHKQQQVRATARRYLAAESTSLPARSGPSSVRFDVAAVTAGEVTVVENAF